MAKKHFSDVNKLNLPFVDKFEIIGNVRILRFKGHISNNTLPQITKVKKEIEKEEDINTMNVLLDLKKTTYDDSTVLGAIILRLSELKRHDKKLGLFNVPEKLKCMMEVFKCKELFLIFESEEAALKSFE